MKKMTPEETQGMTFDDWWKSSEKLNDLGGNSTLNSRLEAVARRAWNTRERMNTDVWEILYRSCTGSFEDGWTIRITGHEMSAIQRALRSVNERKTN